MRCRHCHTKLVFTFIDLGCAPPSNAYLSEKEIESPEKCYPLRVLVCDNCWLVQTEDFANREELFSASYAYFSSYSDTWLVHAEKYVAAMVRRFHLDSTSLVIEIASNDGYLLQYVKDRDIPCIGIEPTTSTADVARGKGITVIEDFFGVSLAHELISQGTEADLIAANNVLAHVPDINDFIKGVSLLLKPDGVATFEFPHLLQLMEQAQFDTIYHEHFSYLSLTSLIRIFRENGLSVFDVEKLTTHGGSLRVFTQLSDTGNHSSETAVNYLLLQEQKAGLDSIKAYAGFQPRAERIKSSFLKFLLDVRQQGKSVAGYGAAAKGNTFLNYSGIRADLIPFIIDRNPMKQGLFMPGSRIPIVSEDYLLRQQPDYIVIFPWNLKNEIMEQLKYTRDWGSQFVTAIPSLEIA